MDCFFGADEKIYIKHTVITIVISTYNVITIIIVINSLLKFQCSSTVQFGQAQLRKEARSH